MTWIKSSFLAKLVIFFFFLLLSFKLFDLALGLTGYSANKTLSEDKRSLILKEYPPNLNIVTKPTNEYLLDTQNLLQKDFLLRTNEDGFIIGPKDKSNTKEKVSIIFFGGSTTECLYVEEENRFPYLVSLNLGIRILNGGVSGNHSMHSFLSMIGKGIVHRPNHIVLMHAVNDLGTLSKSLTYWDAPGSRSLIQGGAGTIAKNSLIFDVAAHIKNLLIPNLWSQTRHIFKGFADSIFFTPTPDEWAAFRDRKYEYSEIDRALVEQFTASLRSFVKVSRAWGIEPILMTQFNRINLKDVFVKAIYERNSQPISYDHYVHLYQKTNEIVRAVAKEEGVLLIDLDVQIPSTNEYIYDSIHLNTKGSQLVAEKITDALKNRYSSVYR